MKRKIRYTNEPIGKLRMVSDFLPPPEKLVFKGESVKVTMVLSEASVRFFKKTARKQRAPYQKLIRTLLDAYTVRYS